MISPSDIGTDEDLARRILVRARSIAPCISSFETASESWSDAVAILKSVYSDCVTRGSRSVKSQRVGSASVEYSDLVSAFDGDPSVALRSLCAAASRGGAPAGSFPSERPLARLWPESYQ
ncbi:hypothetical protein ACIGCK_04800 [Microbacterium sp. NPDC078428]|uniref:hypothetical protein n=1 Tax=Microbacterium sp. NPDC078428 TaxID=3364190 RepID=UPI0037C8FE3D